LSAGLRVLADAVVVIHALFVLFVGGGGVLVLRWPRLAWAHLPVAIWGVLIETTGLICPLTPLEKALRVAAGGEAYEGGFIAHYLVPLIYPEGLTRAHQIALAALVIGLNGAIYWRLVRRLRAGRPGAAR
jgi:hypothetical protein